MIDVYLSDFVCPHFTDTFLVHLLRQDSNLVCSTFVQNTREFERRYIGFVYKICSVGTTVGRLFVVITHVIRLEREPLKLPRTRSSSEKGVFNFLESPTGLNFRR